MTSETFTHFRNKDVWSNRTSRSYPYAFIVSKMRMYQSPLLAYNQCNVLRRSPRIGHTINGKTIHYALQKPQTDTYVNGICRTSGCHFQNYKKQRIDNRVKLESFAGGAGLQGGVDSQQRPERRGPKRTQTRGFVQPIRFLIVKEIYMSRVMNAMFIWMLTQQLTVFDQQVFFA